MPLSPTAWYQPADISVDSDGGPATPAGLPAPGSFTWHGSSTVDMIGPANYPEDAATCAWNHARTTSTLPGSLSNTIIWPGSCPALDPVTYATEAAGSKVGARYDARDYALAPYVHSGARWQVYYAGRTASLIRSQLRYVPISALSIDAAFPSPFTYLVGGVATRYLVGEWENGSGGATIVGATFQARVIAPAQSGAEAITSRWAVATNTADYSSSSPPSWGHGGGPGHDPSVGGWETGAPEGGWSSRAIVETTVSGDSSSAVLTIPSGTVAAIVAWEREALSRHSLAAGFPAGLTVLGASEDAFSSSPPTSAGGDGTIHDRTRSNIYPQIKVQLRPPRWRWLPPPLVTVPPLRWRQRDDGLGVQAARRHNGGTSVQSSKRHRAYR